MKKYIIAGLIILLPLILTIIIFVFVIDIFTAPFLNMFVDFLANFQNVLPILKNGAILKVFARILILIMLLVFIFILGVIARWFFFRSLINLMNKVFSKIPFVKTIYKTLRDIISSFIAQERKAFTKTAMVAFPSKDSYCVGFESGTVPEECQSKVKEKLKPVFVPTAPHPISGYMVIAPEKDIYSIDMTNEDAVKFTVSCGLIVPGEEKVDKSKK
ncbi:MAG: hypothetical protein K940chlam1_00742 [Candidatus Anoxychlamydiales bacterium]|nr:hypothetical protein [Candidatus Anoxychlamydiales bacterium]NGX35376.1 hypothetical protein [Candidatus Anoxychlamydiales bacterium]